MHRRLAFIDTLRGIAVLSVVVQHALEQIVTSHQAGEYEGVFHALIGHYFNFGRFGVVLFFFVSGFVIPNSFPNSTAPVRDFVVSRFFRLYPAYWLSIVVILILSPLIEGRGFSTTQIVANTTMFQMFMGVTNLRISYWTLAIELTFYIGCIALFTLGVLNRRYAAFSIVVAAALAGLLALLLTKNHVFWGLMEVVLNLTAMFFGKVIRDAVIGARLGLRHVAICAVLFVLFAADVAFMRFGGEYRQNFFHAYSIGAAYISAAIVFLAFAACGERMAWRPMSFVGVISYSIYLMGSYAMMLIVFFAGVGKAPLAWLAFTIGVVAASILVSWLTYATVEKPMIGLGHRFRSKRRASLVVEPALSEQGAE